jgi:four helix bundle protein
MNSFRDLKVWNKSMAMLVDVYKHLKKFPDAEKFNLVSQIQRSAVSVPSNIAEGCGRHSNPAFKQFLSVSLGSAYELETQLIISNKLNFLEDESFKAPQDRVIEIQKMTYGLMNSL